jgi:hypothetical protein
MLENAEIFYICIIDNLHVRLIFDLGKKSKFPWRTYKIREMLVTNVVKYVTKL